MVAVDTSRMVFAHGPEALLKERRFMYTNTPPPEGESISFETFSPRMLPSYGSQQSRDPGQPTAFRDVHTLGSSRPAAFPERKGSGGGLGCGLGELAAKRPYPRAYNPYVKETSFGGGAGKRVTFQNDLPPASGSPTHFGYPIRGAPGSPGSPMPPDGVEGEEEYHPCSVLHRSHDDDDGGTTTSGSYTLNVDDDIDDLPPPVAYTVA